MNTQFTTQIISQYKTPTGTTTVIARQMTTDELSKRSANFMHRNKTQLQSLCRTLGLAFVPEMTKPQLIQLIMSTSMKVEVI